MRIDLTDGQVKKLRAKVQQQKPKGDEYLSVFSEVLNIPLAELKRTALVLCVDGRAIGPADLER